MALVTYIKNSGGREFQITGPMYCKNLSPSAHPRNTEDPSPEAEGREAEVSLPVGYEYRDVTALGLRIQRRHCLCVSHTDVTAIFFLF